MSLVPGQERNRLWMQANRKVENFRRQHNWPKENLSTLNEIEQEVNAILLGKINQEPPLQLSPQELKRKAQVEKEVQRLLTKHGINYKNVPIHFVSSKFMSKDSPSAAYFTAAVHGGSLLLVVEKVLKMSDQEITALLEHEIGHLISHDSAYITLRNFLKKNNDERLNNEHLLLIEQRADTHSGIQSKQNVMHIGKGYVYKMLNDIERLEPEFFLLEREIQIFLRQFFQDSIIDIGEFISTLIEKIKKSAYQQFSIGRINQQTLNEIIKICDQPNYIQGLLDYQNQQEAEELQSKTPILLPGLVENPSLQKPLPKKSKMEVTNKKAKKSKKVHNVDLKK